MAAAASAVVAGQWAVHTAAALQQGVGHYDSLWYHLPRAARFAQDGRLLRLHHTGAEFPDTFHPAGSELLHSLGMVLFQHDALSPLLGMAWLALALLAGWCIGRSTGTEPITLVGVGVLAASPMVAADSAGTASNDILAIALLLTSVALLLSADRSRAAVRLAAVAAGLALATKLTVVAPIALLSIGVVVVAPRGERRARVADWYLPLAAAGGFWFVRNLAHTGTPVPGLALPGLPALRFRIVDEVGFSVAHYALDERVWREWFVPHLRLMMGWGWPVVFGFVLWGALRLLMAGRRDRLLAVLGFVVVGGLAAYLVTPTTALGREGAPLLFGANLIYAGPALAVGLALLPTTLARHRRLASGLMVTYVGLLVVMLAGEGALPAMDARRGLAGAVTGVLIALGWAVRTVAPKTVVQGASVLGVASCLALGSVALRPHGDDRYAGDPLALWAANVCGARIGIAGEVRQYRLYGKGLCNHVQYIGAPGPRGELHEIDDCEEWRSALRSGGYEWVFVDRGRAEEADRQLAWTAADPAATVELEVGTGRLFRIEPDGVDLTC